MFGDSERDLQETLARLNRYMLDRCNGNKVEASEQMAERLKLDRRFDAYDSTRLVAKVQDCWGHGARLDLSDPELKGGPPPRPLERRGRY
jgi:hypothetical protein